MRGAAQAFFESGVAGKAKSVQSRYVKNFIHLSVGLGGIPDDFAGKSSGFFDGFGQLADGDAPSGGNVDRLAGVVIFDKPRHEGGDVAGIDEVAG